jgi:hypothetical protein
MARSRLLVIAAACLLPLSLAACGGGSASDQRAQLIEELRTEMADSGAPESMMTCVEELLNGLSDDEIQQLVDDTPSDETKTKVEDGLMACATAEVG